MIQHDCSNCGHEWAEEAEFEDRTEYACTSCENVGVEFDRTTRDAE